MGSPLSPESLASGPGPTVIRCVGIEPGSTVVGDVCSGGETISATPYPCGFERATSSNVTRRLPVCGDRICFLPPCLPACVSCAAPAALFVVTHGVIEFGSSHVLGVCRRRRWSRVAYAISPIWLGVGTPLPAIRGLPMPIPAIALMPATVYHSGSAISETRETRMVRCRC